MRKAASFVVGGLCGILLAAAAFNVWNGISGNGGFSGIGIIIFFSIWFISWAIIHVGIKAFWRRREAQISTMSTVDH